MSKDEYYQSNADKFYQANGNCCAGCDHWRIINTKIGECTKSKLMSKTDAYAGIGITSHSYAIGSSHAITKIDYVCGLFEDTFEWGQEQ